ncbi:MAG: dethiobiotin synthase [Desulfurispora sp.]|uniref:dethiobiotin synthase n=1 Tax=Desulfurispora sp. TaxID=3014275 RepID=UPI00404993EA
MKKGLFITATDTGVGKTAVTAGLLAVLLQAGVQAVALKPVQSGAVRKNGRLLPPDAAFYCRAAGWPAETAANLCCYCLKPPCSPHLAAALSGINLDRETLLAWCAAKARTSEFALVEGAGGLAVPITENYLMVDLARDLGYPLLVVCRPGLGTINHTLLTVAYARQHGLSLAGLVVNGLPGEAGPVEQDNLKILPRLTGLPLLGALPRLAGLDVEKGHCAGLVHAVRQYLNWRALIG